MSRRSVGSGVLVLLCALSAAYRASPRRGGEDEPLNARQQAEVEFLLAQFRKAPSASGRRAARSKIARLGDPAVRRAMASIEELLNDPEKRCAELLAKVLPDAYLKHLARLSDAQIYHIQMVRRMWKPYLWRPFDCPSRRPAPGTAATRVRAGR